MKKNQDSSKYAVPALEKAITIIEHLTKSKNGLSLSEICAELRIPKTSAFTILNTLEAHNYVTKTSTGSFKLGLKLYSIGMTVINCVDIKGICIPYMEQLRDETQFTIHLVAYDEGEMVLIEKIEGSGMIRFKTFVGERKYLNTSGAGKAIAAYLPEVELNLVLSKGLVSLTPNSIASEHAFLEHLKQIREYGYAVDDEEGELGVRCVGAAIFNYEGKIYGGISVSTIKNNLPMQKLSEIGVKLVDIADHISAQLGYKKNMETTPTKSILIQR